MKSEVYYITSGIHGGLLLLVILGFGRWRQDQEFKVTLCRECRVSLGYVRFCVKQPNHILTLPNVCKDVALSFSDSYIFSHQ